MIKKEAYFCKECDIQKLLADTFGIEDYSIVSSEEIGSQIIMFEVGDTSVSPLELVDLLNQVNEGYKFYTDELMDALFSVDAIAAGTYIIDCTW